MKKSLSIIIRLIVVGAVVSVGLAPLMVAAATLSLSPANVSVTQGQNFTVNVAINPQGAANYTVKVELRYPANLLEARSFTFAGSGWLAVSQPGYDLTDNVNGVMIKTAGYPGGISSPATFGIVSFRAKSTGSGNITIGTNSSTFNAVSQNVLIGLPVLASVTVSAPAATPVPTLTSTPTAPTPTLEAGEVEEEEAIVLESEGEGFNLFAAIGGILTLGTSKAWIAILFIVVILGLVYYLVNYFRRKNLK